MKGKKFVHERVVRMAQMPIEQVMAELKTPESGLTEEQAEESKAAFGKNQMEGQQTDSVFLRLKRAFLNPFCVVLLLLTGVTLITDSFLYDGIQHNKTTASVMFVMLLVSGIVRFVQEMKAKQITEHLTGLIHTTVTVRRNGDWKPCTSAVLLVGDLVELRAGDRVPADIRLLSAKDCYVSESIITGESGIQEKNTAPLSAPPKSIGDYTNTLFMGSTLTGGFCRGIVLAVGQDTAYGAFAGIVPARKKGFDRGANSIAWVLIKFMLLLVPVVFAASGLTQGNWLSAFLFSLSVAVGLTPELLPMVITACMARGSSCMSRKQTVVKNINAMQGFGSMDILCVDKTGTLTGDSLVLEYYMDILGNESSEVLDAAYLNSFFHTGIENPLDASLRKIRELPQTKAHFEQLCRQYEKLDELPFDHQRKSAGVLLSHEGKKCLLVKGDVESVVSRCSSARYRDIIIPKDAEMTESVHAIVDEMLEDGMKVLAVAVKEMEKESLVPSDENGLTLLGYLTFFDAPKQSAVSAIEKLKKLHIPVKVLTGDHAKVAASVCRRLRVPVEHMLTGAELEQLDDDEIQISVEKTDVFAELTPNQKAKIIEILQTNGHTVGFLGDGMNDLPAEIQADVGISVDTACESVKEAADVILLKKDLNVLGEGVMEGRGAFANMIKYIKITASSNFGNICAVVIASICLPFFPMTSLQLLLLNLLYDILCLVLPWDHVDGDVYEKPLEWSGRKLPRFMAVFGSASTVFDLITFLFLFFRLCPAVCGGAFHTLSAAGQAQFISVFQTGWFLESMWTQILILHLLRTKKLPFLQSRPSLPVLAVTLIGIPAFTILTMSGLGSSLGMTRLPAVYFLFLALVVSGYLLAITAAKKCYLRRNKELL